MYVFREEQDPKRDVLHTYNQANHADVVQGVSVAAEKKVRSRAAAIRGFKGLNGFNQLFGVVVAEGARDNLYVAVRPLVLCAVYVAHHPYRCDLLKYGRVETTCNERHEHGGLHPASACQVPQVGTRALDILQQVVFLVI